QPDAQDVARHLSLGALQLPSGRGSTN
ncbi:dethiobiotin synthase, partial [Klebsiella pneumoniae]|nr:dethiobiotin synthase [Klebsiella pneumoniae]